MNMENQVCSITLAKRLNQIGVPQKSCLEYQFLPHLDKWEVWKCVENTLGYSAFTAHELLEILPASITISGLEPFDNFWLHIQKRSAKNIQYIVSYICDTYPCHEFSIDQLSSPIVARVYCKSYDENLADALAKLLIQLIEKNIGKIVK